MGGDISVKSNIGSGSIFTIKLPNIPLTESKVIKTPAFEWEAQKVIFPKSSILIVDDLENNQEIVKSYLNDTQATIYCMSNGNQAVKFCESNLVDLILMDIRMQDMDGIKTAKLIKSITSTQKH